MAAKRTRLLAAGGGVCVSAGHGVYRKDGGGDHRDRLSRLSDINTKMSDNRTFGANFWVSTVQHAAGVAEHLRLSAAGLKVYPWLYGHGVPSCAVMAGVV